MSGLEIFGLVAGVFTAVSMGMVAARLHAIPTNTELGRAVVGSFFWLVLGTAISGALLIVGIVASVPVLAIAGAVLVVAGYIALPRVAVRWRRNAVAIGERVMAAQQQAEPPA